MWSNVKRKLRRLYSGLTVVIKFNVIPLYLNVVLSLPEDGRSRPKHVAKYNLIVIIVSCLMYVVYWRCIMYSTDLMLLAGLCSINGVSMSGGETTPVLRVCRRVAYRTVANGSRSTHLM